VDNCGSHAFTTRPSAGHLSSSRAGSPSTSSSAATVGFDAAAQVSAFAPDAFGDLARRCGFADGGGHVRQRDTIPAGLWTRTEPLRLAEDFIFLADSK
jgi:hypothetical protein